MTEQQFGGIMFIIVGLALTIFADPIGRLNARLYKTNARPFQMLNFFGGLFGILVGVLILLGAL
jgi:hypothetical protein